MSLWKQKLTVFKSSSLKVKLLSGFSVMLILFLGVALYNLQQVNNIKAHLSEQNEKVELKLMALELKEMVQELNIIASGLEISKKVEYIPKYNEKRKVFDGMIKKIGDTATTPEQIKWRSQLISLTVDYTNTFDVAAKLVQENKLPQADLDRNMEYLYNESQKYMGDIFNNVDQFYIAYSKDAEVAVAATQSMLNHTVIVMLIASVIVLISSVAIAYLLLRSFIHPIQKLQHAVRLMASGDLRNKINSRSTDELGKLSRDFDHMIDQVRAMLSNTQTIASSLTEHSKTFHSFSGATASANADIIRAIQEISAGADQQANYSEQSSYIITELEHEIETISEFTNTMQRKSREAAFNTHTGSASMEALKEASSLSQEVLAKVYSAMEGLSASSAQINKIVNTITDISQQTNVLALNAAIEAARAGVHGRGFSVIAEEVRQLSLQTNQSSKSIASIIVSLQNQTQSLESSLFEARASFDQQKGKMNDSIDAFQQIRGSMDELSSHIEQIHQQIASAKERNSRLVESVQFVASIAQETAAGVEEVNSTSIQQDAAIQQIASQADDIQILSQKLFQEISRFQIGGVSKEGEQGEGPLDSGSEAPTKTEGNSRHGAEGKSIESTESPAKVLQAAYEPSAANPGSHSSSSGRQEPTGSQSGNSVEVHDEGQTRENKRQEKEEEEKKLLPV
ncbi:methyl-accepting chemotaxis protein [Paenibacillus rigui]|uniref:Methyl-accepting chemotaxis protein n=1 Tax=Paenibacillus rigui TaxID=554312 RepID=A0A229ULY7_9BACL|nr:methyl-accepting chemotaxis protein [Paenibacillus rigui]OXM84315.1 methyl-accepting chemotaxis protein [Paenibacillus rigui]